MRFVVAPLVGQDPGDVGFGGGVDELRLLFWRRSRAHGDDEGVLAPERGDESGLVFVVDFGDGGSGWDGARRAVGAGEGGHFVLSRLEQRFYYELADVTARLCRGFE